MPPKVSFFILTWLPGKEVFDYGPVRRFLLFFLILYYMHLLGKSLLLFLIFFKFMAAPYSALLRGSCRTILEFLELEIFLSFIFYEV